RAAPTDPAQGVAVFHCRNIMASGPEAAEQIFAVAVGVNAAIVCASQPVVDPHTFQRRTIVRRDAATDSKGPWGTDGDEDVFAEYATLHVADSTADGVFARSAPTFGGVRRVWSKCGVI